MSWPQAVILLGSWAFVAGLIWQHAVLRRQVLRTEALFLFPPRPHWDAAMKAYRQDRRRAAFIDTQTDWPDATHRTRRPSAGYIANGDPTWAATADETVTADMPSSGDDLHEQVHRLDTLVPTFVELERRVRRVEKVLWAFLDHQGVTPEEVFPPRQDDSTETDVGAAEVIREMREGGDH